MALSPTSSSQMTCDLMLSQQPVISGSQNATSAVKGATIDPRIRINRPDDENARCKASRVPGQRKEFSPFMQQSTMPCMGLFPSSLSFLYSLLLQEVISSQRRSKCYRARVDAPQPCIRRTF
jgi:hypothetical protein